MCCFVLLLEYTKLQHGIPACSILNIDLLFISLKGSIVSCQLSRTNINDFLLIVSETFKKHLCIYNCLVNILYESLWYVIIFHAYLHRKFSRATIIYSVSGHRNEKPRKKENEMYKIVLQVAGICKLANCISVKVAIVNHKL